MNYFITFFSVIITQCSIAQSSPTFFIKKKGNGDIKKVYSIGDKVKLTYDKSEKTQYKIKGLITDISEDKITVDSNSIAVSSIGYIYSRFNQRNWIGIIGLVVGSGIWIKGITIPKSSGGDGFTIINFSNTKRTLTIMAGEMIALSSTISLAIPKKYSSEKFIFKTYQVP